MATKPMTKSYVEHIALAQEMEHRIAFATVCIGDVTIRGVAVWRSRNGRLRVYFPSYRLGSGWDEAISLPDELRTEIEADVNRRTRPPRALPINQRAIQKRRNFSKNAL
jgi:hypothetical protein